MISRRRFLASGAAVLAAPLAAEAQQAAKIGYLALNLERNGGLRDAFRQGLRDLGYVEGRNVVIDYRDAEGKPERLGALAAELVRLKVDVIVAPGTLGATAAKRATKTIPIVFPTIGDPVADGLVNSLARPGGNITGLSNLTVGLVGKCLDLLKQAVPEVSRVAMLTQPAGASQHTDAEVRKGAEDAARALGVAIQFVEARRPDDIDKAFTEMARGRANGLVVTPYAMLLYERKRILALAAKQRLPAVYGYRENVEAGGLMSYGADLTDSFRRSASYVVRILKGANPAALPVEQPTKFELVINLKTAKTLGLTIPQSLLQQADQVIE